VIERCSHSDRFTHKLRPEGIGARLCVRLPVLLLALLVAVVAVPASTLASPSLQTLDVAAGWQVSDNHSQSFADNETETAHVFRVDARGSIASGARGAGVAAWELLIGAQRLPRFTDLDRVDLALRGRYTMVAGSGYGRPSLSIDAGVMGLLHRDSEIRDGIQADIALVSRTRLTDRARLIGGYALAQRRAATASVWNLRRHRLFVRGETDPAPQLTAWVAMEIATGDTVATGSPTPALTAFADTRTNDDAFAPGRIAYRLDADEIAARVGLDWRPHPALALDLSLGKRWIQADGGIDYEVVDASVTGIWALR